MTSGNYPIVADICWTLYRSNTTFDFLDYTIQDEGYIRLRRWMKKSMVRWANLLMLKLTHRDLLREKALLYLGKLSEEEIKKRAEDFVNIELEQKRILPVWEQIAGREVILVSGTIMPIAEAVGMRIGATKIYSNDIFKKAALQELTDYDIVTDNLLDEGLIRKAHHAYIVCYGNQDRWNKTRLKNIEFITDEANRY